MVLRGPVAETACRVALRSTAPRRGFRPAVSPERERLPAPLRELSARRSRAETSGEHLECGKSSAGRLRTSTKLLTLTLRQAAGALTFAVAETADSLPSSGPVTLVLGQRTEELETDRLPADPRLIWPRQQRPHLDLVADQPVGFNVLKSPSKNMSCYST